MKFLRTHWRLVSLNIVSLAVFVVLSFDVVLTDGKPVFDVWVYHLRAFFQSYTLTNFMTAISALFDPFILLGVTLILFVGLLFFKKKLRAYLFLASMGLGLLSVVLIKQVFAIARPIGDIAVSGSSFPSGHATGAAIFFITILFSLEDKINDETLHVLLAMVTVGLVILTGLSRLYLGVHWTSDVLAGFALGMFWVTLSFLIYNRTVDFKRSR